MECEYCTQFEQQRDEWKRIAGNYAAKLDEAVEVLTTIAAQSSGKLEHTRIEAAAVLAKCVLHRIKGET